MPIYYPDILQETSARRAFSYAEKDAILYALGLGMDEAPLDRRALSFVYERDLQVMPTAATVLGGSIMPQMQSAPGRRLSTLNFQFVVHGAQKVALHRPLPAAARFFSEARTIGVYDKGAHKGALVVTETSWTDDDGQRVATLTNTIFARGDGGFGGPSDGAPEPHEMPHRAPDQSATMKTRPGQALLYRLNGDLNPLHVDPEFAAKAGYPQPILHGLCTYGLTSRAVVENIVNYRGDRVLSHEARFSAPVFPGETLRVDIWKDDNIVSFEATAMERSVKVIRGGKTVLRD